MYYFIINPKASSGCGIKVWLTIKNKLDEDKIDYKAYFTKYFTHASDIAQELTKDSSRLKTIVILGGDGTVNEVLNGINDLSKVILGYIPAGSSNDLARSLGISRNPLKALSRILAPQYFKSLDHGLIIFPESNEIPNKRLFACSSGLGFDANVSKAALESSIKDRLNRIGLGKFTYLIIALKQIFIGETFDMNVIIDGQTKKEYKDVFLISNMIHKYEGGGLPMAPLADPTDGKLDICIAHSLTKIKIFQLLLALFFEKHIKFKNVDYFQCKSIEIKSNKDISYHTDGEAYNSSSHLEITCKEKSIKLIV